MGVERGEALGKATFAAEGFYHTDGIERLVDHGEHAAKKGAAFLRVGL